MAFNFEQYGVSDPNKYKGAAGRQHNIDLIFQNVLGRNADPGGRDYWSTQVAERGDAAYQDLVNTAIAGNEYKDRLAAKTANPNVTEAELDALDSAYVSPFHHGSGSAVSTWRPGDRLTQDVANAVTTDTNVTGSNYSDQTNNTVADVISSFQAHNAAELAAGGTDIKGTGGITGGVQDTGSNTITAADVVAAFNQGKGIDNTGGKNDDTSGDTSSYLTMEDLTKFFADRDAAASGSSSPSSDTSMQDFMKFMIMMNAMRGGGFGGSQYGYGGLNPGGVAPAFNYNDMASWMSDTFGNSLTPLSTATLNVGG